jgi:hypothetical protein
MLLDFSTGSFKAIEKDGLQADKEIGSMGFSLLPVFNLFSRASADTYYKANDAVVYDDWRRARSRWDYFYNRS